MQAYLQSDHLGRPTLIGLSKRSRWEHSVVRSSKIATNVSEHHGEGVEMAMREAAMI